MKKTVNNIQAKVDLLNSLGPLPKEHYNRIPLQIREGYKQVALKMRSVPAKKAKMAFDLAVKLWKPIAMELRADFDKQRFSRTLPYNMKFTDYFLQFQRAADIDFKRAQKPKKNIGHPRPRKTKKSGKPHRRRRASP